MVELPVLYQNPYVSNEITVTTDGLISLVIAGIIIVLVCDILINGFETNNYIWENIVICIMIFEIVFKMIVLGPFVILMKQCIGIHLIF